MDDRKSVMISSARAVKSDMRIFKKRSKSSLNNWFLDNEPFSLYQDMLNCKLIVVEDLDNEVFKFNLKRKDRSQSKPSLKHFDE